MMLLNGFDSHLKRPHEGLTDVILEAAFTIAKIKFTNWKSIIKTNRHESKWSIKNMRKV